MKTRRNPSIRSRQLAAPAAALLLSLCGAPLHAAWTGTAGDLLYNTPGNWAGNNIDNVFSGTIGWSANTVLTVGSAGGTQEFTGLTFSYADLYNLTLIQPAGAAATWNLNGDINVDVAGTTSRGVTLGSPSRLFNLDLGGATRIFSVNAGAAYNATGNDTLTIIGNITNGSVRKTGGGTLLLNSANSLDGSFAVESGAALVQNSNESVTGSLANVSQVVVSNSMSRLVLNSSATNRLNDSAEVVLNGGIFGFQTRSDVVAGTVENVGDITLAGARSAIGVVSVTGQADTVLQAASLNRDTYSTLSILSSNDNVIGNGNAFFKVTSDQNILDSLKGGGGAAGSTTLSILPWASAGNPNGNTLTGSLDTSYYVGNHGLVTYTSAGGFRALTNAEYQTNFASAAANENVRITANTTLGASDKVINALHVATPSGTGVLDLNGQKLTLTSGALVTNSQAFTLQNGTVDFGTGTGFFMAGRGNTTVSANLQAGSGLVLASGFRFLLTGTINAGSGPLVINSGALYTQANNRLAANTQLRIDRSATFQIDNGSTETIASLSGSGTVLLNNNNASLNVGTSFAQVASGREVVIGNGGVVAPGDASGAFQADRMTFAGVNSLRFEEGSALYLDLSGATNFDSISVAGGVAINGGTLYVNLLDGFLPTEGQTFASIAGTAAATGTGFTSIVDLSGSGYTYAFTADGNNWVLTATAIPEPSSFALLGGAVALAGGLVRRRRRG